MNPEFAIINGGNNDVLITSVLCVFLNKDENGWYAPEPQRISGRGNSFTLQSGKSHHCMVTFPKEEMDDRLAKDGEFKQNGSLELYHKDMAVIVEWVDSKGVEHKAEPKIANYGFKEDGSMTMFSPLEGHHDLYKKSS